MTLLKYGYYLEYEYDACFDDGGIGHDSWWAKADVHLHECKTDEEAIAKAREILAQGRPCGGAFCNNKGRRRLVGDGLRYIETKIQVAERKLPFPKTAGKSKMKGVVGGVSDRPPAPRERTKTTGGSESRCSTR